MSKVFFSVTMSLDGFIAPEQRYDDVGDKRWIGQWMALQKHMFDQRFFRENLKLGEGGQTGEDNRILEEAFARTGASIMGKRMFDVGEPNWPEDAPFHTPVFVLTRQVRTPWERTGGTTFYFVNDGSRARSAAPARSRAAGTCASPAARTSSVTTSTQASSTSSTSRLPPCSSAREPASSSGWTASGSASRSCAPSIRRW